MTNLKLLVEELIQGDSSISTDNCLLIINISLFMIRIYD